MALNDRYFAAMKSDDIFVDNPTPFAYGVSYLTNRYIAPLSHFVERQHGLLWPEWVVIFCLGHSKGWNATDIVAATGRPKNTISRAVGKLLKLSLIQRCPSPTDGRLQVLHLTPQGRCFYREMLPHLQDFENEIYCGLNPREREQFLTLLEKLVRHVNASPPKLP